MPQLMKNSPAFAGPRFLPMARGPVSPVDNPARCEVIEGENGAELLIYGALYPGAVYEDEVSALDVIRELSGLNNADVTVRINSPGGVVTEGIAIYNALRAYGGKVTCQVDGLAASAASEILMASNRRIAAGPGAFVMIHNAWGLAIGGSDDIRSYADVLDKMDAQLVETYVRASGMSEADVRSAMAAETWYTAAEALEAGLLTEVLDAEAETVMAAARGFDLSGFAGLPAALRRQARSEDEPVAEVEPVAARPANLPTDNFEFEYRSRVAALANRG